MSVQVKRRRDTAANIAVFTPAQGELIVDTTNNRLIAGDGVTPGGWPAAKLSEIGASALMQIAQGPNGSTMQFGVIETLVTLAGASTVAPIGIPANCIVFSVGARTITPVTGAPSYGVGVSGNPTQFGGSLNIAPGSINYGIIGPSGFYAATPLIITATSGSFTGGTVRLSIHYMLVGPPTS